MYSFEAPILRLWSIKIDDDDAVENKAAVPAAGGSGEIKDLLSLVHMYCKGFYLESLITMLCCDKELVVSKLGPYLVYCIEDSYAAREMEHRLLDSNRTNNYCNAGWILYSVVQRWQPYELLGNHSPQPVPQRFDIASCYRALFHRAGRRFQLSGVRSICAYLWSSYRVLQVLHLVS